MSASIEQKTRSAYLWTRLLSVPFWGLISLLSMILYKDMQISPLQITLILTLKPMSALLAPYWSQAIHQKPHRLLSNMVWANILRFLPFLFMPWISSAWVIILAFGAYMMLYRGVIPAWMETIKCNMPPQQGEKLISFGSTIDYCGTALLPFGLGILLDQYEQSWRWLFPLTAGLGLISTLFLLRIPRIKNEQEPPPHQGFWQIFKETAVNPWKQSWGLVRENSGFAAYQIGFMLGGAGLMIMQPALPIFFVDVLNLSYTNMLLALTAFKGIGVVIASPFWLKLFQKRDIYYFSGLVTALAGLFPLFLLGAQFNPLLLYAAYALYGIMQSGSELSWHMSGPIFAKEKESTLYSGTNVLTVGIRGCIVPALGALLFSMTNSTTIILLGSLFCFLSNRYLMNYSKKLKFIVNKSIS